MRTALAQASEQTGQLRSIWGVRLQKVHRISKASEKEGCSPVQAQDGYGPFHLFYVNVFSFSYKISNKKPTDAKETIMQQEFRNLPSDYLSSDLDPYEGIFCSKCSSFWLHEFAPEYCPECGAKVTDNPGQADGVINDLIKLIRLGEVQIPISKCNKCQLEYPGGVDIWENGCLRCYGPLTQYGEYSFRYKVKKFVKRILSRRWIFDGACCRQPH